MVVPKDDDFIPIPLAPVSESIPRAVHIASIPDGDKQVPSERTAPMLSLVRGTVVARKFALIREIASGSMGTVFEAHDMLVDRVVALKLIHPYLCKKPDVVARFLREAQAAARIRHPNVVAILEMGQRRDGTFYIVQEMLVGRTLREYLNDCGKLDAADAISIALPIMGGLAAAHASRIVHRDVKPENIILWHTPSGERVPKLIDFGVAKFPADSTKSQQNVTHFGTLVGTPHYMSPEQAFGRAVDVRTDIWAMGVVLFEMLTGKLPFPGTSYESVLMQIRTDEPLRLENVLPSAAMFAPVIAKALERPLEARFATMQQMREALELIVVPSARAPQSMDSLSIRGLTRPLPAAVREAVEEIALDDADLEPISLEEDPPTVRVPSLSSTDETSITLKFLQPRAEWRMDHEGLDSVVAGSHLDVAESALSINALRPAIEATDLGLLQTALKIEQQGKLWLIRAIAQRWLGEYAASAISAEEAMSRLVAGTTGWHAAFGHLLIAQSQLGNRDRIVRAVDELRALEEEEEQLSPAHTVSACRLTIFTLRFGLMRFAMQIFEKARNQAATRAEQPPFVHAWLAVARAEFAVHSGDLTSYVRHVHTAVERFTAAGDMRNASLQRSNIGNAFLLLGGYEHACSVFEETIRTAAPMQLDFVNITRANLAISWANLKRLDAARSEIEIALAQARAQGNRRCEAISLVYLARIRSLAKDISGAIAAASDAERIANPLPAIHAYALAVWASLLLEKRQLQKAEKLAHQAMQIVDRLNGIEEGEALVRMTYARVLRARGCELDGQRIMRAARSRLLESAEKISELGWRKSFLTHVGDNRELLQLAEEWLGKT